MPITTIDPQTALVVIDLQRGIVGLPLAHPAAGVIANAAKLARAFRHRGAPVVLVNVAGISPGRTETPRPSFQFPHGWTELVPELEAHPSDIFVTKHAIGAIYGTSLDFHLRRRHVTQIVLCGIATGSGVESTARAAHDHGYHLTFVTDAMTDRNAAIHEHSVKLVFPRIGETGTTAEVLAKIEA